VINKLLNINSKIICQYNIWNYYLIINIIVEIKKLKYKKNELVLKLKDNTITLKLETLIISIGELEKCWIIF